MIDFSVQKMLKGPEGEMLLNVNTCIEKGSLTTIYGKSGVGKTSLLRIMAGLLQPDKAKIIVNGKTWANSEKNIFLSPQKRRAGLVFQDYALFPNMTVKENIEFAFNGEKSQGEVNVLLKTTELTELQNRKPETLSGGQQQRVALARALAQKPEILLLDEPLSALDRDMRIKLQHYILEVHKKYELTTLLVSHDVSEILKLSNKVMVIEDGKVTREGSPAEVFTNTQLSGKFQFTGEVTALEKHDFIFIVTVLIGQQQVKVVVDENEAASFTLGDTVLVASKAFNPVIRKVD